MPSCWEAVYSGTNMGFRSHITNDAYYIVEGKSLVLFSSDHATIGSPSFAVLPQFANDLNGVRLSFTARRPTTDIPSDMFVLGYFASELLAENFDPLDTIVLR